MHHYQCILTHNDCYIKGRTIVPKGIMVHSTGANNPKVSRYVPGDDVIGRNRAGNHWDMSNEEANRKFGKPLNKCVHAMIGRLADGSVGTVQTLLWNQRGWHCGRSGNDTHISFEICEDALTDASYFKAVYREAVELTAWLCKEFGLDPLADGVVICHAEGYQRGIASNHGDVLHWFPKFGKNMDDFRADVVREMKGENETMSYEQWKEYMDRYRQELAQQESTMPAQLAIARAMQLTDGTRPRDFVTREEAAVMAKAAAKR